MRILLADDQTKLSSTLRLWLEHLVDFSLVGVALDVTSLIEQSQMLHPDIVLLDWKLAGLSDNGTRQQLLQQLHTIAPTMHIVALTTDLTYRNPAFANQVDAFVSKSEPPDYLAQVLQQIHHMSDDSR